MNIKKELDKIRASAFFIEDRMLEFKTEKHPYGKQRTKILSLSDLHAPFINHYALAEALQLHKDADIVVLNGDLLDNYSISTFPKRFKIPLELEYSLVVDLITLLSKMFPRVILVSGNHEDRFTKLLEKANDSEIKQFLSSDILELVQKGYQFNNKGKMVKRASFKNVTYEPGVNNWYCKIGQIIFAHPNPRFTSAIPGRTVISTSKALESQEDFDALIIGHTHRISTFIDDGRLLAEQGSLCWPMDYAVSNRAIKSRQVTGWAVAYLDKDGRVDFTQSRVEYWGCGKITKRDLLKV